MADSDDDYVEAISEDDAAAPQTNGYGTRRRQNGPNADDPGLPSFRQQYGATRERWEDVQRSWDTVTEGADGSLAGLVEGLAEAGKRQRLLRDTTPLQRGIIRHTVVIIDLSANTTEKDYRPTRHLLALRAVVDFVNNFFEQNPISQLAILITRGGICKRMTDLSGNPAEHVAALIDLQKQDPTGQPSLQNSLEMSRASLAAAPTHGTKEVIVVYGSLLTADPGNIHDTINALVKDRIKVSVVGMGARMFILSEIVAKTNGLASPSSPEASSDALYGVAMQETHFHMLIMQHTTPPAVTAAEQQAQKPALLPMGFPSRIEEEHESFCACHQRPFKGGYQCPRCSAKVCTLPMRCPTCNLQLVLSTHLARSYHHLFPLKNFIEVSWAEARAKGADSVRCFACTSDFPAIPEAEGAAADNDDEAEEEAGAGKAAKDKSRREKANLGGASESSRYACTECGQHFCIECDLYLHEVVHNCPGCLC